jgi:hypothetical protein
MNARDKAISMLSLVLHHAAVGGTPIPHDVANVVDALIDATRAPESAHTRAAANLDSREGDWSDHREKTR